MDGTVRQVGSVEDDQMRPITGDFMAVGGNISTVTSAFFHKAYGYARVYVNLYARVGALRMRAARGGFHACRVHFLPMPI